MRRIGNVAGGSIIGCVLCRKVGTEPRTWRPDRQLKIYDRAHVPPLTYRSAVHRYNCASIRSVQSGWENKPFLTPQIHCRNLILDEPLITIVDDDEAICRALQALVQSLGYRAGIYTSADAFLASKIASSSQCIITDVQMPGLSGLDLKRRLNEEGCETPVIMITARMEAHLDADARKIGAICLLHKPFEATALISCLERALALRNPP